MDEAPKEAQVLDGIESAPELIHGASVCNKIFRTCVLREEGLRFAENAHFEDVYVTLPVLLQSNRIALVPHIVYEYRKREAGTSIMDSIWTRDQNYWDHLKVEEYLSTLRDRLPESRRPVVDLFMVRSLQGFLLRAPQALGPPSLREYFERARAVYASTPPETLDEGCLDARHRLPFLALKSNNFEMFCDPNASIQGVEAVDGQLNLQLSSELPGPLRPLVASNRTIAHLESVDVLPGRKTVRVSGRFTIDGHVPINQAPARLGVRVRGSGLTVEAQPALRRVQTAQGPVEAWSGFVADLPVRKLKDGDHRLRLVFLTDSGQASSRLRPSPGVRRSARALSLSGKRAIIRGDRFDNVTILVAGTTNRKDRLRWHRDLILGDLRHIRRRRPLWRARLAHLVTSPFFRKRNVWLLVERKDTAQDNSFFLFRHLRRDLQEKDAFYVVDRNSPHRWKVTPFGNVVDHGSWRHKLLLLHARWLIGSYDIDGYLLPTGWSREHYLRHLSWRTGPRRAFLQHGVIYNDVSQALNRSITGVDVFISSAARERDDIRWRMHYSDQVALTGLPRFDNLTKIEGGRRVLVMPTWRSSLVSPSYAKQRPSARPFDGSEYQAFFRDLLNDKRLLDALEAHNVELEVLPHYEFAGLFDDLVPAHRRVRVQHHARRDVQQAIRECSLFVTDWSSTFFDAALLGIPQVLTPFDEGPFRSEQYAEGYFNMEDDGFGPVARAPGVAVEAMLKYIANDFVREERYTQRVNEFFAFNDANNCARVVDAIRAASLAR